MPIARITHAASGCGPGDTYHFYIITDNGAALDSLPTAAYGRHQGATDTALVSGFSAVVETTGVYFCTLVTPNSYAYCDEMLLRINVVQGGVTQSLVWAAMVSNVAFDAAGGVILQPSEHVTEIPADILATLLQTSLGEYLTPATPTTSPVRLTTAALANTPPSGGLTTGQVNELNSILDGVNLTVKSLPADFLSVSEQNSLTTAASIQSVAFITIPGSHTMTGTAEVLTHKQYEALLASVVLGDAAKGVPIAGGTAITTYYLSGADKTPANITSVATITYDASGRETSRVEQVAQPFPAVG